MTDQRDKAITEPTGGAGEEPGSRAPATISRRALMGGASVALPTILTLNSNTAFGWAITSGTIGTRAANPAATGEAVCAIGTPVPGKDDVYPVGGTDFWRIDGNLTYRTKPGDAGTLLNAEQVCESDPGTQLYYRDGNSPSVAFTPPGGAVASLTSPGAMTSFNNNIFPDPWV